MREPLRTKDGTDPRPLRQLWAFYALSLLIVIGVMAVFFALLTRDPAVAALTGRLWSFVQERQSYMNLPNILMFAAREPASWLIVVFAAAPTLAAITVSGITRGRSGLRELFGRLRPIVGAAHRSSGRRAYVVLFALLVGVSLALLAGAYALGGRTALDSITLSLGGSLPLIALVLLLGAFLDEGGLLEELGWRGFAQPRLLQLMASPVAAAVVLGLLWWAWHLPRELPALLGPMPPKFLYHQSIFLALCVGQSIVIMYFVNRTGGSVIPAILIHGGTNVWSKALEGPVAQALGFGVRDAVLIIGALVLLAIVGPRLGKSEEAAQ